MTSAGSAQRTACAWILAAAMVACGGGGGGSSGGGTPAPAPAGSFTLSSSTVNFSAKLQQATPGAQTVRVTLADSSSAALGAAYVAPQVQPGWLNVAITGAAPNYNLVLTVSTTDLPAGEQSAVITVGTANAAGAVLRTQELRVNYTVLQPIAIANNLLDANYVFGHSLAGSATNFLVSADPATTWHASSNQPWVTVPATNFMSGGSLPVTIDSTTLTPGSYTAVVSLVNNADATDSVAIAVDCAIFAPTFVVTPGPIVIGSELGLDMTGGQDVVLSLDTGTNSYPWTATLLTQGGGNWLSATPTAGTIGATTANILLNADRSLVVPGSYAGTLRVQTTIRGTPITQDLPVTFNKEGHWLHVAGLGAAFSKFPGRSVLTRRFDVRSSQGRSDVPWTATANQGWLNVTASGMTGGQLVLTANPAGLANGQYFANVTVNSSRPDIENNQVIRVGLRVGGVDPVEQSLPISPINVVANPVEPYVYANDNATSIVVYDVYSATVVRTFAGAASKAGNMVVSHDGRTLFVNDETARLVRALDAETGAQLRQYPWPANNSSYGMAYMRPNGQPLLIIGGGSIFDADTGFLHATQHGAGWYAGWLTLVSDPHDTYLFTQTKGLSPSSIGQYLVTYSALPADRLSLFLYNGASDGSNGQDLCVSADGARLYAANGAPYDFPEFNVVDFSVTRRLEGTPYPNNSVCGWNGLFFGGAAAYYSPFDVWGYRPDGTQVTALNMHPGSYISNLLQDTLVLSGDNTRLIASTEFPSFDFRVAPPP